MSTKLSDRPQGHDNCDLTTRGRMFTVYTVQFSPPVESVSRKCLSNPYRWNTTVYYKICSIWSYVALKLPYNKYTSAGFGKIVKFALKRTPAIHSIIKF